MNRKRTRQKLVRKRRNFKNRAVAAGTAAAISLGAGVSLHKVLAAYTPDIHQLVVPKDVDADLLANREEFAIGYQVFRADQNRNGIPDGVELAMRCAKVVAQLPEYYPPGATPDKTYKIGYMMDGLEACDVCGTPIHMGGWAIINPKLNLRYPDPNDPLEDVFLPDLALHYMEHGSFDCYGERHKGRADVARLLRVLAVRFPYDPNAHQLPLDYFIKPTGQLAPDANDYDGDLMADTEELAAGFNLYDPDQDANLVPDGVQFAMQCQQAIAKLPVYSGLPEPEGPYKISYLQHGQELCQTCGDPVNMGWWEIVNPKLHLSMNVYDVACHYMSHGSFSYSGLQYDEPHEPFHNGRVKLATLARILELPNKCGHLGTLYLPGDHNKDCKEDFKDFADFAEKWLESTDPNQNDAGPSIITYNVELCDVTGAMSPQSPPIPNLRFSVEVEGSYINFKDRINANCCRDKIELTMTLNGSLIKIHETEYLTTPCLCLCDFPTAATLGPFDDGTYALDVYKRTNDSEDELIGRTTVTIGPG